MFSVEVNVHCPDLVLAVSAIATLFQKKSPEAAPIQPANTPQVAPAPVPAAPEIQTQTQTAVAPIPDQAITHTAIDPMHSKNNSEITLTAATSTVPLAQAPTYTAEQVGKAGADLLAANPGKLNDLLALLGQFGVRAITELRADQLGFFATALRGLGAKL